MQPIARERIAVRAITNSPVLLVPAALVAAVGWFAPVDVLDRLPWVITAAKVLGIGSVLDSITQGSTFSQVAFLTYLLVAVAASSASLWASFRMFGWRHVAPSDGRPVQLSRLLGIGILGLAALGIYVAGLFLIPGDPSFCEGCTTRSRFGLGALLGLSVYVLPVISGMSVWRLAAAATLLRRKPDGHVR